MPTHPTTPESPWARLSLLEDSILVLTDQVTAVAKDLRVLTEHFGTLSYSVSPLIEKFATAETRINNLFVLSNRHRERFGLIEERLNDLEESPITDTS